MEVDADEESRARLKALRGEADEPAPKKAVDLPFRTAQVGRSLLQMFMDFLYVERIKLLRGKADHPAPTQAVDLPFRTPGTCKTGVSHQILVFVVGLEYRLKALRGEANEPAPEKSVNPPLRTAQLRMHLYAACGQQAEARAPCGRSTVSAPDCACRCSLGVVFTSAVLCRFPMCKSMQSLSGFGLPLTSMRVCLQHDRAEAGQRQRGSRTQHSCGVQNTPQIANSAPC